MNKTSKTNGLKISPPAISLVLISSLLLAAACTPKNTLDNAAEDEQPKTEEAEKAQTEADEKASDFAKVIKKSGTVKNRGGYVKILVNRQPVTNFDISRRAKFVQLRRMRGNSRKIAEKEMIEQLLKQQEARRRGMLVSDAQVNQAYARFAKGNRASVSQMNGQLARAGVGADHFKEFMRTQMSWQRLVQARFRAETDQKTERDVVTQLRKSGTAKPEVTEYNIQQYIFVVPEARRSKASLRTRRAEANTLRQKFSGCENSFELAKSLKDVSVLDRKRILEPELPDDWKDDVVSLNIGQTSRVRETRRGVEFMALCNKRVVNDDRAAQLSSKSNDFESFNKQGSKFSENYLNEVRKRATIVYK